MINSALEFARRYHAGQVDRAGVDYMNHVNMVYDLVSARTDCEVTRVAAILHDVVEDTDCTIDVIESEFGHDVAVVVGLLTKTKATVLADYYRAIKNDPRASLVKLCDMMHNSDLNRLAAVTDDDLSRLAKYQYWTNYLNN